MKTFRNKSRCSLRHQTARWLVAFALAVATASSALPSRAQSPSADDTAAKELMRRGYAALQKNDTEAAHNSFSEAWKKKRHFAVALSLAEVEMRLGRYVDAADHWQFVIRSLPDDLADKRAKAEEQLAECKKRVGTLTVLMKPPEATLIIDGAPIVEPPADRELYLNPGDHDIRAEKDGKRSTTRSVHLSAGAKLSLNLAVDDGMMKPPPPPVASSHAPAAGPIAGAPAPATTSGSSLKLPLAISGAVLTLGGATLGTVFLLKSNAASDDAQTAFERAVAANPGVDPNSACAENDRPLACDEADGRVAEQRKFRNVAVGAFIGTGVMAAAAVAVWALWPDDNPHAAARRPVVTPVVGVGFSAVTVSGQF